MAESRSRRRRSPEPPDRGLPARGCNLALPLERLPAPCVGRMVRDRGETASERGVRPCPVRRRRADGVRPRRCSQTRAVGPRQASRSVWTYPPPRQDAPRRLPPTETTGRAPSRNGWDQLRLPWPNPRLGTVSERQEHGSVSDGQRPVCPRGGRSYCLVPGTPPLVVPRPASPPVLYDAGPLRLLWRWWE